MAEGLTPREAEIAGAIADIQDRLDVIGKYESQVALKLGEALNEVLDAMREQDPRLVMALEAEHLDREGKE